MGYIITAGEALISGMRNTASLVSDVGDEFSDLQSYAVDMNTSASIIINEANNLDCGSGTSSADAEDSIESIGEVIEAAALAILGLLDGLPEKFDDWADAVEREGINAVQMGVA